MFSSRSLLALVLILGASAALVNPAAAQEDVVIGFIVQADSVYQVAGEDELSSYIQQRAALVGAAVGTLLEIAFEVGMQGDRDAEAENVDFALQIARMHAESGDSAGPLAYVQVYEGWSDEDRASKLAAQGFEAEAVELRGAGDYDAALDKFSLAAAIYDAIGDTRALAVLWGSRGIVHYYRNDFEAMADAYTHALELRREIDDRILMGKTLNGMGTVYYITDRFPEAIDWYSEAVELRRSTGDRAGLVTTLTYRGNVHWELGELNEAARAYEEADAELQFLGDDAELQRAQLLLSRANVEVERGNPDQAMEFYREALASSLRLEDNVTAASTLLSLAQLQQEQGRYREAMADLERCEPLLQVEASGDNLIAFFLSRSRLYQSVGDLEAARDDLLEARRLAAEYEMIADQIEVNVALSRLYRELGFPDRGLPIALQAVENAQQLGSSSHLAWAWREAGECSMMLGDGTAALEYFGKSAAIDAESGDALRAMESRLGMANALAQLGRGEEARELYRQVISQANEMDQPMMRVVAHIGIAHTYEDEDPQLALENYGEALDLLDQTRARAGDLAAATFFVNETGYLFQEIARYYAERHAQDPEGGWAEEALEVTERSKSRGLLDRIGGAETGLATLAELQSVLPEGTVLLQYALGDSASLLWAIDQQGVDLVELPPKEVLRPQVERLRAALSTPGIGDARLLESSMNLYKILLRPVRDRLESATEIVLVPDGSLYLLPFELLVAGAPREGDDFSNYEFLGRRYITSYAPSSTVWLRLISDDEHPRRSTLLAMGNPDFSGLAGVELPELPFSEQEVELVGMRVDADQRAILVGSAASETALRSTLLEREPLILHMATHGLVDPAEPDRSCVALSADQFNDGFLYSAEIESLEPAPILVVLSACETATGRLRRGEGVVGLGRSFLASGSQGVVASLWPVSDESTSVLMDVFYENLLTEKGAAESLTMARRALLADPAYAHPYHWAAFVLVGDPAAPWIEN